jgi:hypothetical protein
MDVTLMISHHLIKIGHDLLNLFAVSSGGESRFLGLT